MLLASCEKNYVAMLQSSSGDVWLATDLRGNPSYAERFVAEMPPIKTTCLDAFIHVNTEPSLSSDVPGVENWPIPAGRVCIHVYQSDADASEAYAKSQKSHPAPRSFVCGFRVVTIQHAPTTEALASRNVYPEFEKQLENESWAALGCGR